MFRSLLNYAPVQVFSALSIFLLIAVQTSYLTVESYGLLAIFMLIMEVVRSCSSQWINTSLLRLYPSEKDPKRLALAATALKMIWGLYMPALGFVGLGLLYYQALELMSLLALGALLLVKSLYLYFLEMARLNEQLKNYRKAVICQSLSSVLLTLAALEFSAQIETAILALCLSYVMPLAFIIFKPQGSKRQKGQFLAIVGYGTPLMVSGILTVLSSRVDRFFIADDLGIAQTGVYAALSNTLLGVMALVFMVVAMPLYPELTKLTNKPEQLRREHGKYLDILLFVSLPSLIGLCYLAEPIIKLFLGETYLEYGLELFWIMAISAFLLNFRGHFFDHGLQFSLNTQYLPFSIGGGVLVNVVLVVVLIEPFGLYGAAWASVVGNLVTIGLSFVIAMWTGYRFSLGSYSVRIVIATLAMAVSLHFTQAVVDEMSSVMQFVLLLSAGGISYLGMHVLLNTFDCRQKLMVIGRSL